MRQMRRFVDLGQSQVRPINHDQPNSHGLARVRVARVTGMLPKLQHQPDLVRGQGRPRLPVVEGRRYVHRHTKCRRSTVCADEPTPEGITRTRPSAALTAGTLAEQTTDKPHLARRNTLRGEGAV